MHREVDSQTNQKPKKSGGLQHRAAEVQFDLTERHPNLGTKAHRAIPKRYITPREKFGKERQKGSTPRCDCDKQKTQQNMFADFQKHVVASLREHRKFFDSSISHKCEDGCKRAPDESEIGVIVWQILEKCR